MTSLRRYVYALIPLLYVINLFVDAVYLDYILFILAVLGLIYALPRAQRLFFWSSLGFLSVGALIFLTHDLPFETLIQSAQQLMGLLGIFVVLPFMQAVLRLNRYDRSMRKLIKYRVQKLSNLYRRTSLYTYVLSVLLTIATLPISVQSLDKLVRLPTEAKQKFYTQAMLRAYSLALFWSPVELLVIVSIDVVNADYLKLLPVLLVISLAYLGVDWVLQRRPYGVYPNGQASFREAVSFSKQDGFNQFLFFSGLVVFFVLILAIDYLLNKGLLVAIFIVLVPFCFVWMMISGKLKLYMVYMNQTLPKSLDQMHNVVALFIAAGFFIFMVEYSALFQYIIQFIEDQYHRWPLWIFFFIIVGVFWMLSFSGFHSVVSITLIAQILKPVSSGLENNLALLFIGATISLLMISPFNLATAMMATLIRTSPLKIIRWNLGYACGFVILVVLAAYFL